MAKRKIKRLARRATGAARRIGRYVGGVKGTALELGGGVAAYYGVRALSSNFEKLNEYWYGPPIAAAIVGHFVKRKAPRYAQPASAMIGAAGVIGAMAFEANKQSEQQGGTEGFDTGILLQMGQGDRGSAMGPRFQPNYALDDFNPPVLQHAPASAAIQEPVAVASVSEAASLGR